MSNFNYGSNFMPFFDEKQNNTINNLPYKEGENQLTDVYEYDPDKYPPDIEFAKKHGIANRIAKSSNNDDENSKNIDVCECCGYPIENEELNYCCDRTELFQFGIGFTLYFEFILYCIILLSIICIFSLYSLIANFSSDFCELNYEQKICSVNFINSISITNRLNDHDIYKNQAWINLATVIAILISLHFFRRMQLLTEREGDQGLISPSDFTIIISKLPENFDASDLKTLMKNKFENSKIKEKNTQIKKINIAYNISSYVEKCTQLKEIKKNIRKGKQFYNEHGSYPEEFDLSYLESKQKELEDSILLINQNSNISKCGIAFITFDNQKIIREIDSLQNSKKIVKQLFHLFTCGCFESQKNKFVYDGVVLKVERAPEPNDVKWENLMFSETYQFKQKIVTFIWTVIVLILCFSAIFGLSICQNYVAQEYGDRNDSTKTLIKILGFVSSFLILFINTCLLLSIRKFSALEKPYTLTNLNISVAQKLSFAQFFNTALLIFFANYFILGKDKLFKDGGIITDVYSLFLTNSFVPILSTYFNPWYAWRLYRRYKISRDKENSFVTQEEANEAWEGGPLDMAYKYAISVKTMWFTSLYVCIIPFGIFFSILNLILTYFLDKYLFLRRYARPPMFSSSLNREMVELIEYCPFLMSVGTIIFHYILFDPSINDVIPEIIALIISGLNFLFPIAYLTDIIFKKKIKFEDELSRDNSYDDNLKNFITDYDRSNPVTRLKALNEWILLAEKGGIQTNSRMIQEMKKEISKNTGKSNLSNSIFRTPTLHNNFKNANLISSYKKDKTYPDFNAQKVNLVQSKYL